jgi:hypothetical protein
MTQPFVEEKIFGDGVTSPVPAANAWKEWSAAWENGRFNSSSPSKGSPRGESLARRLASLGGDYIG